MSTYKVKVPATHRDAVQWRQAAELLYSLEMRSAGYLLDAMADQILGTSIGHEDNGCGPVRDHLGCTQYCPRGCCDE